MPEPRGVNPLAMKITLIVMAPAFGLRAVKNASPTITHFNLFMSRFVRKLFCRCSIVSSSWDLEIVEHDSQRVNVFRRLSQASGEVEAVQHMVSSGKVPTVRSDRRVFVDVEDSAAWIREHKQAGM